MKIRLVFVLESYVPSSQLTLELELCLVGPSAKQPHLTNEETKAQGGDGSPGVTSAALAEADLLAQSTVCAVFSEARSLFRQRSRSRC